MERVTALTVSVPTERLADDVRALLDPALGVEIVVWHDEASTPEGPIDIVVPPYMKQGATLRALTALKPRLVQGQAIGYDGVADTLPEGLVYANASGVHETATSELTLALILVAQRGLPEFVRAQDRGDWAPISTPGLADRRVLLLGYGGVGKAIAARIAAFEAEVVPVASRARDEDGVRVHGIDELATLAASADILVNALPGGPQTHRLIDDAVLAALPDGALVVNIGRGPTVDTDALVEHLRRGRLRMASDVFDPEPLPADHPLWSLPGAIIVPHVGGRSEAMHPRIARLVATQAERMVRGEDPINVVIRT